VNKSDHIAVILESMEADRPGAIADANDVIRRFNQRHSVNGSLAIKILSVVGGIAGSIFFLAFLFIAGLYDSAGGMIMLGSISIIATIALNALVKNLLLDTVVISFYIIGLSLLAFGCGASRMNVTQICLLFLLIGFLTLCIVRTYMFVFLAVLVITGSVAAVIMDNRNDNLIHIEISALVLVMVWMFNQEAMIRSTGNTGTMLYHPVRTGIIISILSLLSLAGVGLLEMNQAFLSWVPSALAILGVLWLGHRLISVLGVVHQGSALVVYAIAILMLVPTIAAPGISISLLIVLLSFYVNYKSGFVAGIIAFLYFVSRFYYDLSMTLLVKSLILMAAGVLFLIFFLVTSKKFKSHEKN
jgi:hypothetical protein